MDLTKLSDIGVVSTDHLESLVSRGYAFNALEVSHESEIDAPGLALVQVDDLHSIDSLIRQDSVTKFELDIGWTQYQSINSVVIRGPIIQQHALVYAQSIAPILKTHPYLELSILLPLCPTPLIGEVADNDDNTLATWEIWDTIRSVCEYSSRLHVALEIPTRLPSLDTQSRWLSEDVRQLFLSASVFLVNNKGYPVLPKAHQAYVQAACKFGPTIVLQDIDKHQRLGGDDAYLQYMRYILKNAPAPSVAETIAPGYQDFLQQPLQPLQDNLSSSTYEVFERDPVKYAQYEKAIFHALSDRPRGQQTFVAVVGAGRGPLVDCCLRAADDSDTPIVLFAIEKNPHAVQGLRRRMKNEWKGKVTLVETDMRHWQPEEYVDILVSELLGSFGDNELSPECLDGVQHVLNPASGVSIPSRYTPFISPLMTPKIYQGLRHSSAEAKETPYVVLLSQCSLLSPTFEPLWHFHHPCDQSGSSEDRQLRNKRYGRATFHCESKGVCHGVAGYFESILYGDVELSTVPDTIDTKSPDMVSWFPIFFPLTKPLFVPADASAEVHFWRETDGRKVWYEYLVEIWLGDVKISTSDLINQRGTKSSIGL
ncbi:Arginine N-methyltransferase skb1 [Taphrina deformans PYCC 5710]|uniref:Protein arginine N-methyltransferase n=1 Tax=Taphrina deformans (strain PYCC 5710 / ATCC 11124 / CBS 356.35 / IMI 108563 / JCM 9778 / NBRC 8474) TaxID=1097556 RepID=R4X929_TAPDE|nr:Arginine N-methyltransferase skb1 [Taphrina deformans PYCC 5710]|eukprot:CCG82158.1 Arginine N-methyltransferase skb1 [Taphrina deformans PYCC 5710]